MKAKSFLLGVIAVMALSMPAKADIIFDTTTGKWQDPNGIAFMNGLHEGYVALSDEREWATDLLDAEHFNHKARRAARRSSTMPDVIMDRDLREEDIPDLAAALVQLRKVYDQGARFLAPKEAATAQVSFDCWIEATEGANPVIGLRTHSSWRQDDIDRCKAAFNQAMGVLNSVSYFRLTGNNMRPAAPAMAAAAVMPAPEAFIVYFAFDSSVLNAAANRIIDDAVAVANSGGIVDLSVTGHADRSGAEDYNLNLSLRRAATVREALIARGVKASGISVAGRGEAEPAIPTADGVREPGNRRVEIILL